MSNPPNVGKNLGDPPTYRKAPLAPLAADPSSKAQEKWGDGDWEKDLGYWGGLPRTPGWMGRLQGWNLRDLMQESVRKIELIIYIYISWLSATYLDLPKVSFAHSPGKKRQQPFVWLHRWHPKCGTPCRPFSAAWYLLVWFDLATVQVFAGTTLGLSMSARTKRAAWRSMWWSPWWSVAMALSWRPGLAEQPNFGSTLTLHFLVGNPMNWDLGWMASIQITVFHGKITARMEFKLRKYSVVIWPRNCKSTFELVL